jgi:hypothetical protein
MPRPGSSPQRASAKAAGLAVEAAKPASRKPKESEFVAFGNIMKEALAGMGASIASGINEALGAKFDDLKATVAAAMTLPKADGRAKWTDEQLVVLFNSLRDSSLAKKKKQSTKSSGLAYDKMTAELNSQLETHYTVKQVQEKLKTATIEYKRIKRIQESTGEADDPETEKAWYKAAEEALTGTDSVVIPKHMMQRERTATSSSSSSPSSSPPPLPPSTPSSSSTSSSRSPLTSSSTPSSRPSVTPSTPLSSPSSSSPSPSTPRMESLIDDDEDLDLTGEGTAHEPLSTEVTVPEKGKGKRIVDRAKRKRSEKEEKETFFENYIGRRRRKRRHSSKNTSNTRVMNGTFCSHSDVDEHKTVVDDRLHDNAREFLPILITTTTISRGKNKTNV